MTVAELCIVMLTSGITRLECEGKEYDSIFEFNDEYHDRTIQSVERIAFTKHNVLLKVNLAKEYDSLTDVLMDAINQKQEGNDG